jgi:putative ABC transport system permease protein
MFRNYLKTAWRNLLKNKFYSAITIFGLTTGLAAGLLILLWVQDERNVDGSIPDAGNIYQLGIDGGGSGEKKQIFDAIIAPIAVLAKNEIPEVKAAVRIKPVFNTPLFIYREKKFTEDKQLAFVDPSFFSVFGAAFIEGNPKNPFPDINSMVITETTAKKYFDREEPVGKLITTNSGSRFTVSAVIRDFPVNSSLRYSMLIPMALNNKLNYIDFETSYNGTGRIASMDADWVNFSYQVYLQLRPGADIASIKRKLRAIHEKNHPEDAPVPYFAQPLTNMHLYTIDGEDAGIGTVRIFSLVALLILIIACINYVNLSTARSMLRAKEVSMRKIVGAARFQLFLQFMVETTVLFILATVLAIGCMYMLMPVYSHFSGKELTLSVSDGRLWTAIGATFLCSLAASSIYPALLLASFNPLQALRGKVMAGVSTVNFRKLLVVGQFVISFLLISGTLVIANQLNYIRNKSLGYDKSHILYFQFASLDKHYEAVKAELLKQPGVSAVARSSDNIVDFANWTGDDDWDGKPANVSLYLHPMEIDQDFIPFYKIQLQAGTNFTGSRTDSARFILNEAAVQQLGFKNPIGRRLRIGKTNGIIGGVVRDFHYMSMRKKIEPAVFIYDPGNCWHLSVRTTPGGEQQAINAAKQVYREYNKDLPFKYAFLDETFDQLYKTDRRTGSLFTVFSALAIVISCLGLFGLATFTAQLKTREIGIRKVLGASVGSIVRLLSGDFLKPVATAIVLAIPIAWFAMHRWLQDFAYRKPISWTIFAVSGLLALAIALITISLRTIQAGIANPVKSLRTD